MNQATVSAPVATVPFFTRVEVELKKLFVHAPGWEASAAATLTYIAPMVEMLVALADPAATAFVVALIQRVQSAMAAAAVVIKAAGPAPTLTTYLHAIVADVAQIEASAGTKDPATSAKLSLLIATITAEVNAILDELPRAQAK